MQYTQCLGYPRMNTGSELRMESPNLKAGRGVPRIITAVVREAWAKYMVVDTETGIHTTVPLRPEDYTRIED